MFQICQHIWEYAGRSDGFGDMAGKAEGGGCEQGEGGMVEKHAVDDEHFVHFYGPILAFQTNLSSILTNGMFFFSPPFFSLCFLSSIARVNLPVFSSLFFCVVIKTQILSLLLPSLFYVYFFVREQLRASKDISSFNFDSKSNGMLFKIYPSSVYSLFCAYTLYSSSSCEFCCKRSAIHYYPPFFMSYVCLFPICLRRLASCARIPVSIVRLVLCVSCVV